MLALEFLTWWYSRGWLLMARNGQRRLVRTSHLFSLPILIRTLFAPWRRIMTYPGAGMQAHIRAATDNLVSRVVGFVVRILVLIAAGLILSCMLVLAVVELIVWPLIPLAVVAALLKGLIG